MKKLIQSMFVVLIATVAVFAQISNNGLVAWFPFTGNYVDGSNSGIVLDTVYNNVGGPSLTADRNGVANAAYEFDGYTKAFKNSTSNGLPSGNSNLTISAWIYMANGGVPRVIVSWGTDTVGQKKEIVFYHTNDNNYRYIGLTNGVDSIMTKFPTGSEVKWTHVAVTVNSGSTKFYINGTPSTAQPITFSIQSNSIFGIASDMFRGLSGSNHFGGKLDDIAIYNRALTDQEITYLKNSKSVKNSAPVFTSTAITSVKATESYSYSITTTDADNHVVTLSVPLKPTGMTFTGNKLTWTPTASQKGTNSVTIIAKDEMGDSTVQNIVITVAAAPNTAPTFTSVAPTTAKVSQQYMYSVTTKDTENQVVTLYLKVKPSGMSISSGKITWNPKADQAGKNAVTIVAKDEAGDSAIQSFEITVEPSTSVISPVIPQKLTRNQTVEVFYLANGRACTAKNFKGIMLNKGIKRLVIR